MYYRLADHIALRSWKGVILAYYVRNQVNPRPLTLRQAKALLLCDGEHDLEADDTIVGLMDKGMITACEKGEHPSDWSTCREYDNRCVPEMNLMITGKCNYNCLHCFNASDNAPLMTEWTFGELCDLFDQARDCGVNAFTITGGEPMVHKRFMDILREIHRRDMFVHELNTNGFYITQKILDEMKEIGCNPLIKISFDGTGFHDWMRDRRGAEQKTLDAMRLCIENGFKVKAQTQVHRKNVLSMMPTAGILNEMGVETMRIIRTTEAPRWAANAKDACLEIEEYYETMLAFSKEYISTGMKMNIDIWNYLRLYPKEESFHIVPVAYSAGEYKEKQPCCSSNRSMTAVTSSGEVVPCLQMSGKLQMDGISFGNLHTERLKDMLTSGRYLDTICTSAGDLKNNNSKCDACKWFVYCAGGCRALGYLFSGEAHDLCGEDVTKCIFFNNGWYEKVVKTLSAWKSLNSVGNV